MNRQVLGVLLVSALLLLVGLWRSPSINQFESQPRTASPSARLPVIQAPFFQERSIESGLNFIHTQLSDPLAALTETLGSGGCVLDFDNDGLMDLFLVGGSGHTRYYGKHAWWHEVKGHGLYRNVTQQADQLQFENVTPDSGIAGQSWGMGCTAGDLDNDGFDDLLITNKGQNLLYKNNSDGTFTDVSALAGLNEALWSTSAVMADFDGDGLLDIYIANYIDFEKGAVTFEATRGFKSQVSEAFRAALFNAQPNRFYHNQGEFKFMPRGQALGVDNSSGRSLAVSAWDADRDGDQDLLVVNDIGSPSRLFINTGGAFIVSRTETGGGVNIAIENAAGSHGAIAGDWDNSGVVDWVITSPGAQATKVLLFDAQSEKYQDLSWDTGIAEDTTLNLSGWGGISADFNNDGRLDLLVNHGLITPDPDSGTLSQGQGARLWMNQGQGLFDVTRFQQVPPGGGKTGLSAWPLLSGRSALKADFDNDGDIDVVLLHNNEPLQLMVNRGIAKEPVLEGDARGENSPEENPKKTKPNTENWVGVQLVDKWGNGSGSGARVVVSHEGQSWLRSSAEQYGFLSRNDNRFHFGLGYVGNDNVGNDNVGNDNVGNDNKSILDRITIYWADGELSVLRGVPIDGYITVRQGVAGYEKNPSLMAPMNALNASSLPVPWQNHPAEYYQWLLRAAPSASSVNEIHASLSTANQAETLGLYQALLNERHPVAVSIAKRALFEGDERVQIMAIEWFESEELELAIPWLVTRLKQDSDAVVCAAAKAFEFYFHEEEAVVVRKSLSLPPLIRLLEGESTARSECALSALAESEHYRAIQPVIRLLEHQDEALRVEAIRTLGRLRHLKAETPLLDLLNRDGVSVEEQAETLIALSRINSASLPDQLQRLFSTGASAGAARAYHGMAHSVALMGAVIGNESAVVVIDKVLVQFALLLEQLGSKDLQKWVSSSDANELTAFFEVLGLTRDTRFIPVLKPFLRHKKTSVRLAAYRALIGSSSELANSLMSKGFKDQPAPLRTALLSAYLESKFALPQSVDMVTLIDQTKDDSEGLESLLLLLRADHREAAVDLIRRVLGSKNSDERVYRAALTACQNFPGAGINVPRTLLQYQEPVLNAQAVACQWTQQHGNKKSRSSRQGRGSALVHRQSVDSQLLESMNALLLSEVPQVVAIGVSTLSASAHPKAQMLLIGLAKSKTQSTERVINGLHIVAQSGGNSAAFILMAATTNLRQQVRIEAYGLLSAFLDRPGMEKKLWRVLEDKKATVDVTMAERIKVAEVLYGVAPERVAQSLFGSMLNKNEQ